MARKEMENYQYYVRTLKRKTVGSYVFELDERSDMVGDPVYYVSKEIWNGAWKTIAASRDYQSALNTFKNIK